MKDKVFHALVNPRIPLSDRQESVFPVTMKTCLSGSDENVDRQSCDYHMLRSIKVLYIIGRKVKVIILIIIIQT